VCTYCKAKKVLRLRIRDAHGLRQPSHAMSELMPTKGFIGLNVNQSHVDRTRKMKAKRKYMKNMAQS